jgi:hypothetical protein
MINNRFENQKEIYQALIDGKKICCDGWGTGMYLELSKGFVCWHDGNRYNKSFDLMSSWSLYQEPRKTIKHYRWLRFTGERYYKGDLFYPEWNKPADGIKRLDDEFIVVDEDGNFLEKEQV